MKNCKRHPLQPASEVLLLPQSTVLVGAADVIEVRFVLAVVSGPVVVDVVLFEVVKGSSVVTEGASGVEDVVVVVVVVVVEVVVAGSVDTSLQTHGYRIVQFSVLPILVLKNSSS